jgi:hypothetical protein
MSGAEVFTGAWERPFIGASTPPASLLCGFSWAGRGSLPSGARGIKALLCASPLVLLQVDGTRGTVPLARAPKVAAS